jgi:class 3 adenylate cyclase/tetratricopeptide (TPR) repeat protein
VLICPGCGEENPPRFRLCGYCGTELAPAAPVQEVRKTVTVVFSDLKGSTSLGEQLDSEALREVMSRYFDVFQAVLERHGGTVEKFIGDAVMAVFGLPRLHEDDALRAVRAAAEMRTALSELNDELEQRWGVRLANRTGVNTGEVVAGDPTTGQRLVTGDTVNVAARLEQAAPENDVLIGETTFRLVKDAVDVEAVEPLPLKGKSELVPAYRLLAVHDQVEGLARRVDTPMVGREAELGHLLSRLDAAAAAQRGELVTILGPAGVGKSRLVHEFLEAAGARANVLRGQCLPYGEGITFWALSSAVRQATGTTPQEPKNTALAKLDALVGPENHDVAARLAATVGLSSEVFPLQETFWATRRLLEILAEARPAVLVVDDIHWAEETFLELLQHVRDTSHAPVLVVCTARHELVEEHPEWTAETARTSVVTLGPLSVAEGEAVVANLLGSVGVPHAVLERITLTAEGNPLYVEQTLSMLIDNGTLRWADGAWELTADPATIEIPPTISALITARLDQLAQQERIVVERGAVIGQTFWVGAVAELTPSELATAVTPSLEVLIGKELVRHDRSAFEDEDAYSFRHILIRDSAYSGLLKRTRAELHERFAGWMVATTGARADEFDEIIGYHLEQAYWNRHELGPIDDAGRAIAQGAAQHLSAAGRRALTRRDMAAATNLLERAVAVLDERHPFRLALLPDLGEALIDSGEFARADTYLEQALAAADDLGDLRLHADAQIVQMFGRYLTDPEGFSDAALALAEDAIAVLELAGDHTALAKAWRLIGSVHGLQCRYAKAEEAVRNAVEEARRAGDRRQELQNLPTYALSAAYGPMPVPEAIRRCRQVLEECAGSQSAEGLVLCALAHLHGLAGEFDQARLLYGQARERYEGLGLRVHAALVSLDSGPVEMLAGDFAAAERELRRDYETLTELGDKSYLPTTAALLAHALTGLDRDDEAEQLTIVSEETSYPDDLNSEVEWRCARARILAGRGDHQAAERLARDAVAKAAESDFLEVQADAGLTLAEVLAAAGRPDEASVAAEEALGLTHLKQATASSAEIIRTCADLGITLGDEP